jgi:hypothetical protein
MAHNTRGSGRRLATRSTTAMRRTTAAALGAGLALALGLGTAEGATAPGWHVTKTLGPYAGATGAGQFLATGAQDGWSDWTTCNPCGGSKPVSTFMVQRWNGRSWHAVLIPKGLAALEGYAPVALAASSSTNAWVFNGLQDNRRALHWTGRSWRHVTVPSWVVRGNLSGDVQAAAYAFAPGSMWVFSFGIDSFTKPETFAARYTDGRWSKSYLPVVPSEADAVSATDIWVLGDTAKSALGRHPVEALAHWGGRRWSTLALPVLPKVPAGTEDYYGAPASSGPGSVWVTRNTVNLKGARTLDLEHWNGSRWQTVGIRYANSYVDELAIDGRGGVWMAANGPGPKYSSYFYHYRAGRWSRISVPAASGTTVGGVGELVNVPGTTTMLAAGQVDLPHRTEGLLGAIWQYGG